MNPDLRLLELLADGRFHSGPSLSAALSVSRTAIWKKAATLRQLGVDIHAVKGKGYRLGQPFECLQQSTILRSISDDGRKLLQKLTVLRETDSTNTWLMQYIGGNEFHGHVVLAEYQTGGRGRQGNRWISPYGTGICLSAGWHYPQPVETTSLLSLAAGVAIIRSLRELGITDAGLKWPNDIYWQGSKLGGILVELRMESSGPCNAVIGVGLNYALPASMMNAVEQSWVDVAAIQRPPPGRNRLAAVITSHLLFMLQRLENSHPGEIIDEWRQHDCMKGRHATLLLPDRRMPGTVLGIDSDGALLFAEGTQPPRRYHAGEISLRSAD